ncbi:MAG TPA: hypothetical protein VJ969_07925 [Desulfopila sp.]|nr:hypothetical protein [Desulfopila sp.]
MHNLLHRLKPGVPKDVHLFAAALLWSLVGTGLLLRGTFWLIAAGTTGFLIIAVIAGSVKSLFILDKSARKGIDRILRLDDGSCLGAVYSKGTWLLVAAMMGAGYLLRHSPVPLGLAATLYAAVGWSLLLSSRLAWKAWAKSRKRHTK